MRAKQLDYKKVLENQKDLPLVPEFYKHNTKKEVLERVAAIYNRGAIVVKEQEDINCRHMADLVRTYKEQMRVIELCKK